MTATSQKRRCLEEENGKQKTEAATGREPTEKTKWPGWDLMHPPYYQKDCWISHCHQLLLLRPHVVNNLCIEEEIQINLKYQ